MAHVHTLIYLTNFEQKLSESFCTILWQDDKLSGFAWWRGGGGGGYCCYWFLLLLHVWYRSSSVQNKVQVGFRVVFQPRVIHHSHQKRSNKFSAQTYSHISSVLLPSSLQIYESKKYESKFVIPMYIAGCPEWVSISLDTPTLPSGLMNKLDCKVFRFWT